MQLNPVKSSMIKAIGYDNIQNILQVQFSGGASRIYQGITPEEYETLITAESVGKHYNQFIKKNHAGQAVEGVTSDIFICDKCSDHVHSKDLCLHESKLICFKCFDELNREIPK